MKKGTELDCCVPFNGLLTGEVFSDGRRAGRAFCSTAYGLDRCRNDSVRQWLGRIHKNEVDGTLMDGSTGMNTIVGESALVSVRRERRVLPLPRCSPKLDVRPLAELFEGNRAALVEVLDAALESIQTDALLIRSSVDTHQAANVIDGAHHLKGTCGDLRATALREVAALIETAQKEADWPIMAPLMARLQCEVDDVCIEINRVRRDTTVAVPVTAI